MQTFTSRPHNDSPVAAAPNPGMAAEAPGTAAEAEEAAVETAERPHSSAGWELIRPERYGVRRKASGDSEPPAFEVSNFVLKTRQCSSPSRPTKSGRDAAN